MSECTIFSTNQYVEWRDAYGQTFRRVLFEEEKSSALREANAARLLQVLREKFES